MPMSSSMPTRPTLYGWKCEYARVRPADRRSLLQYGGIYLDIDTFILKPFASASLMSYHTAMAVELDGGRWQDEMNPKGLCNAIIISRPGAVFIERWLRSYESFDDREWADHSVVSRRPFHCRG